MHQKHHQQDLQNDVLVLQIVMTMTTYGTFRIKRSSRPAGRVTEIFPGPQGAMRGKVQRERVDPHGQSRCGW